MVVSVVVRSLLVWMGMGAGLWLCGCGYGCVGVGEMKGKERTGM